MPKKPKIIVGLSGGVDSAVSALLLKQQGYDVSGLFMQNWQEARDDGHCTADQDLTDARAICDTIGIELQTVNFSNEYWNQVFEYCLDEYAKGRTPNPDIWCNREIKFNVFLEYALQNGADFLATGHYSRIRKNGEQFELLRGLDQNKDQSYFLYTLNQHQLAHSLFPVGELEKPNVRKIAEKHHFINFNKKDSTGICFIGERKFKEFLSQFILARPGNMETPEGKVIGKHDGVMFYTLGQRKGLNIGGRKDADEAPWYVVDKDVKRNVLIVAQGHDHPLLYKDKLSFDQAHWVSSEALKFPLKCTAKIRYRQEDVPCVVEPPSSLRGTRTNVTRDETIHSYQATFENPQWAITPGQSIVFYQNEICLGGGIIC